MSAFSRRDLFRVFGGRRPEAAPAPAAPAQPAVPPWARARTAKKLPVWLVPAVRTETCLAHQGSFCSTCVEQCGDKRAIVVEDGKPSIDQALCDGCGACVSACPAPITGLRIMQRSKP